MANDENRVRLLLVAEFSTGGSVESLLCLVKGIDRRRYEPHVLFFNVPAEPMRKRFEATGVTVKSLHPETEGVGDPEPVSLPKLGLQARVREIFGERIESAYFSAKYLVWFVRFRLRICLALRRQIARVSPDLVHFNNGLDTDTPGILAARLCRVPVVCHVRAFARQSFLTLLAAKSVQRFVCISRAIRDELVSYGVDAERCTVVSNGVDSDVFDPDRLSPIDLGKEFGFPSDSCVAAVVGRLAAWKGQDDFLRAIARARQSNPRLCGLVVGDAEKSEAGRAYEETLRALTAELGLEEAVVFAGHRTDVPNLMRSADIVVLPSSLPEPFGRVVIESMAVGTPVIATEEGGVPDIITHGVDGFLVPIRDPAAIADAIAEIVESEDAATRMRAAALSTVREKFTLQHYVDGVVGVYESIPGIAAATA